MDPSTLLPIRPTSPTLTAALSSLSTTISNLEALPSQTRWPAYIPLTSRARVPGHIVHPNEVKVNLGAGWWVDMTAAEAAAYLRRKKTALLEEQARLLEGVSLAERGDADTSSTFPTPMVLPPPVQLNGLFMGLETSRAHSKGKEKESTPSFVVTPVTSAPQATQPQSQPLPSLPSIPKPQTSTIRSVHASTQAASSSSTQPPAEAESLEQVLERFLANEKSLADASGGGAESTMTEDGLPIHEIHETASGEIIGVAPEPTLSEAEAGRVGPDLEPGKAEDYHSEEAKGRRRMLWEKVFGPDDDEEEDEEEEVEVADTVNADEEDGEETTSSPIPSSPQSTSPIIAPLPSVRLPPPSSAPPPPRSILKPPPPQIRKKSVSFDPTVPLPPDSPDLPAHKLASFQLPIHTSEPEGEFSVRPVPVIQTPVPGKKGDGFGGMKRGFLDPPGSTKKPVQKEEGGKKKPSLFAQRMAQSVVKESHMPVPTPAVVQQAPVPAKHPSTPKARIPNLPTMASSATSATNTLRSSVVEKPIASSSTSAGRSGSLPRQAHSSAAAAEEGEGDAEEEHDDEDDEEDEEEDEDEYDLDDALLAREVALEYHRRRAYASPYMSQDPDDPNYGHLPSDPSDSGGVLLAMPQIDNSGTGGPQIINPTPDDFRRFVRVGKLENGNLVLAPGEEGWSDDEEGEDGEGVGEMEIERQRKRDNRRKVMEGLLSPDAGAEGKKGGGEEVLRGKGTIGNSAGTGREDGKARREVAEVQRDMPPTVGSAPKERETETAAVGGVKERAGNVGSSAPAAETPKKMSRFKAARMGGA